ncbi:hypothetical protein M427DRAFT_66326 [Gonapodya prolifera JEL478]|uniref:D-isomer specific 2-hydroxyacid dehydrogenase NAD-binding domain-containing protein n=1 Tax=Gonapodya prolifera (strain JEL478) TaxID=1344416 RepID=A0A139AWL4_GONPJ|nr:hypothetical protein M427DRAFT_66326 [Gonapodya prolifera JEL478]|eukprot:KXS20973.1 hypothetical protein M427DRAFT_66326 [Gonapodya prolifera JEL478]
MNSGVTISGNPVCRIERDRSRFTIKIDDQLNHLHPFATAILNYISTHLKPPTPTVTWRLFGQKPTPATCFTPLRTPSSGHPASSTLKMSTTSPPAPHLPIPVIIHERVYNMLHRDRGLIPSDKLTLVPITTHDAALVFPEQQDLFNKARVFVSCWIEAKHHDTCANVLRRNQGIGLVHCPQVGIEHTVCDEMYRPGLVLTNSTGLTSIAISEFVLLLMLSHVKHLHHHLTNTTPATFWTNGKSWPHFELAGRTVFLLGLGSIGKEIAKRCKAFGMDVVGARRKGNGEREGDVDEVYGMDNWPTNTSLLSRVDFFIIAAPASDKTEGIVSREVIRRLKKGVYIINIARGSLLDEVALAEAVGDEHVAGAALDVHRQEPIDPAHPLFKYHPDRILLTPHMAWSNDKYFIRTAELIVENSLAFVEGREVKNRIELLERVDGGTGKE